jgi:hypothetical protein
MVRPHGPPHCEKGRLVPISQQHSRALDPARRFSPRAGNRAQRRQILFAERQFDRPSHRRHPRKPRVRINEERLQAMSGKMNPAHRIGFKESMN